MKFVCAGFPKTGTKSASNALGQLGFTVCDFIETQEFLSPAWESYINGDSTIEEVVSEYDRLGFDTNQDVPGNFLWEKLYRSLPTRTKVILTVRDNDQVWWDSWLRFIQQEVGRASFYGLN